MDSKKRQQLITQASLISLIANIFIAGAKIIIGLAASSIAIVSEGVNNGADAVSSIITLIGTKLSARHPDEKHPFGYGRIEYISTSVLALLIIYAGIELAKESVDGILHPAAMSVNYLSIGIVAATAVIKFFLGTYTIGMGKKAESAALDAMGRECRNDSFFSILTIVASILYIIKGVSIDGYAGLIFALIILKMGLETLVDTVSSILGRPGKEELAKAIYREIRKTDGIINAVDMMLHDYGPDSYSGSVNIEIDHKKSVGEIYEVIHDLQLRIMHEYHVVLVFGIYAVDTDSPHMKEMRNYIGRFVKEQEHVKSYHALYLSPKTNKIYIDFIVDYELRDWDQVSVDFKEYMKAKYPDNEVELTVETEFV